MAKRPRPISASNPPESRGKRLPKDVSPLTTEEKDENVEAQAVFQPTAVEPSPKKATTRTTKPKNTE